MKCAIRDVLFITLPQLHAHRIKLVEGYMVSRAGYKVVVVYLSSCARGPPDYSIVIRLS